MNAQALLKYLALVSVVATGCAGSGSDKRPAVVANSGGSGGGAGSGAAASTAGTAGSTAGAAGATGGSSGSGGSAAVGGGAGTGGSNTAGAAGSSQSDLGDIEITDVTPADCVSMLGQGVQVVEAGSGTPTFDSLGTVGDRRFAYSRDALAITTFSAWGTLPSQYVYGVIAVAGGSALDVIFDDGQQLLRQRYDDVLAPVGQSEQLGTGGVGCASIARGSSSLFSVWSSADTLVGHLLYDGAQPVEVDLGAGSAGVRACHSSALWSGNDFVLFWTRLRADGQTETSAARIDALGHVTNTVSVLLAGGRHDLVQTVRTSSGYALLVDEGVPAKSFVVIRLSKSLERVGPALRLDGTSIGHDLAARGDELGIGGALADGRGAFVVLDASGGPTSPWVCVDDGNPALGFTSRVAVEADSDVYEVLARHANGSAWLLRLTSQGTIAP